MRTRRRGASAATVLARAGVLTAMSAASLFVVMSPQASADGCVYDSSGNTVYCWVDSEPWEDPWDTPGGGGGTGGGGGYESGGGDNGGGDDGPPVSLPPGDAAANQRRAVAAQENGHMRMRDGQCFTAVTGMAPTSANRRQFASDVERFTIVGRSGTLAPHGISIEDGSERGTYVVAVYDNWGQSGNQVLRDLSFLLVYVVHYGIPTTVDNLIEHCGE